MDLSIITKNHGADPEKDLVCILDDDAHLVPKSVVIDGRTQKIVSFLVR